MHLGDAKGLGTKPGGAGIERRHEGRLQWRAVIGRIQLTHRTPFGGLQRWVVWQFAACIQIYLIIFIAFLITLLIREFHPEL